ncbi:MAG TPA: hypothetical protein VKV17_13070 [Bryobacteraceae bacterium]|nr:hypothetical protein [Bryobacteraceae bacterium]
MSAGGSTTKKAVLRRFEREPLSGYVNLLTFLQLTGIELLSQEGNVVLVPYHDVKMVAFVRDFDAGSEPGRQVFQTRPKSEGLWVRLEYRDGDVAEGILPNNLLQIETHGFTIIPPDAYGNTQRLFVPRMALRSVQVLGVVGSPLKKKPKPPAKEQIGLFEE